MKKQIFKDEVLRLAREDSLLASEDSSPNISGDAAYMLLSKATKPNFRCGVVISGFELSEYDIPKIIETANRRYAESRELLNNA